MAYAALGAAYTDLDDDSGAAAEKKAYEVRPRMTETTRFQAETGYYTLVTGEQEKAYPVLLQWVQTFPRDVIGRYNLARCLQLLGQQGQAADEAREAARLPPTALSYSRSMSYSIVADRLAAAKPTSDEAHTRKLDSPFLREVRVLLAFLQND